ncbi:hypothetical protein LA080_011808 [Diaporthe eres]|nr:hypothetical protein LA080_011808 [Diaporthe eres]
MRMQRRRRQYNQSIRFFCLQPFLRPFLPIYTTVGDGVSYDGACYGACGVVIGSFYNGAGMVFVTMLEMVFAAAGLAAATGLSTIHAYLAQLPPDAKSFAQIADTPGSEN